MKRSGFSEGQMIAIERESEARAKTHELRCPHGISQATFYTRRKKVGCE